MILGDPAQAPAQAPRGQIRVSIDEMFRRLAERRPDAPALADPPNRKNFTDGAPRRLTYAEADRMVAAIAGRLRRMGLPVDAVIGVQMCLAYCGREWSSRRCPFCGAAPTRSPRSPASAPRR